MFSIFLTTGLCWWPGTHTYIGNKALEILKNDGKESYDFYNKLDLKKLKLGWTDPDDVESAAGTHYYVNPEKGENTGQYYKNAKRHDSDESARTRLEDHYNNAKKLYKAGNITGALHLFGRACHYLMDIGTPPHSAGVQYPLLPFFTNHHKLFENYTSAHLKKDLTHATTAKKFYGKFDGDKWGITINELCILTSSYKKEVKSKDNAKYKKAAQASVVASEQYLAAFLDKFYQEIK